MSVTLIQEQVRCQRAAAYLPYRARSRLDAGGSQLSGSRLGRQTRLPDAVTLPANPNRGVGQRL
ncbi:MAG: hypothetical protein ACXWYD_12425, partial [Candidatus Binatia bacterium]